MTYVFVTEPVSRMRTAVGWSYSHGELILFGIITRATTDPPAAFVPVFQYEMMSDSLRILSLSLSLSLLLGPLGLCTFHLFNAVLGNPAKNMLGLGEWVEFCRDLLTLSALLGETG